MKETRMRLLIPPIGRVASRFSLPLGIVGVFLIGLALSLGAAIGAAEPAQAAPQQPTSAVGQEAVEGMTYGMESVTPYEFRGDVRDLARLPLTGAPHSGRTFLS
jgi:hypothetical protein